MNEQISLLGKGLGCISMPAQVAKTEILDVEIHRRKI